MGFEITARNIVVIIFSFTAIILGIMLTLKVSEMKDIIEYPLSSNINVKVEPETSQQGTLFLITAITQEEKEQQELILEITSEEYSGTITLYDDGNNYDEIAGDSIYGGFFDSENKAEGKYDIKKDGKVLGSFYIYNGKCQNIKGSGNIKFVFVPYGYTDLNEFKEDAEKIITGENSLLEIEPFKSNIDKFSFSIVKTTRDLNCKIGYDNVATIAKCDNKIIAEEASNCNFDNVIVLLNSEKLCGSSSMYAKICAKNEDSKLGLVHEIGHNFANLADEYVYEGYDIGEINAVNCDLEGCEKWQGITQECYQGCTYENLYRSSENSIMREYVPWFNIVCVNQIQKIIDENINIKEEQEKPLPKSYFVNLEYSPNGLEIKNVYLKPVESYKKIVESDYSAVIRDKEGKIFETNFLIPNIIYPLPNSSSVPVVEEKGEFVILLPFSPDADKLEIKKENDIIDETSLAVFSDTCGNKICESYENHVKCAEDCDMNNDRFCETSECDTDCESQRYCRSSRKIIVIFLIFLLVAGIIIARIILKKIKVNKEKT